MEYSFYLGIAGCMKKLTAAQHVATAILLKAKAA